MVSSSTTTPPVSRSKPSPCNPSSAPSTRPFRRSPPSASWSTANLTTHSPVTPTSSALTPPPTLAPNPSRQSKPRPHRKHDSNKNPDDRNPDKVPHHRRLRLG